MSERNPNSIESQLGQLKDNLLLMGGMVESMMNEARDALIQIDPELAGKIIERDKQVDKMEQQIHTKL